MMQQELKVVKMFDQDGDKRLNAAERKAAREYVLKERAGRGGPEGPGGGRRGGPMGGPGGPMGPRGPQTPPEPGRKISPAEVKPAPAGAPLYDGRTLRTLFLDFESADWEKEMADFNNTDVEMPAKLTVDGKSYVDVGVHFRGMSSFGGVGAGYKRSLNVSVDFVHADQNLGGYRTLNLLNAHEDPSFLRTVLYYQIAREYIPAPKANFVRVVINGENWGVYVSAQQFNKEFIKEWHGTTKGARWKTPGSPGGKASLAYLGDDPAPYKKLYEIKSKDDPAAWARLIQLCKVLNDTPPEELEAALAPILDVDGALKFLALENALVNNDGYWVRSSDYSIYLDEKGRFHVIPHDANETFSSGGGPGGPMRMRLGRRPGEGGDVLAGPGGPSEERPPRREGPGNPPPFRGGPEGDGPRVMGGRFGGPGGPGGRGGVELDPLVNANDPSKPLASKLLAVPALKARYLGYVRDIAEKWLDWSRLGPMAEEYHALIDAEVKADTRKLDSYAAFENSVSGEMAEDSGPRPSASLKSFAEKRRAYLLNYKEAKK